MAETTFWEGMRAAQARAIPYRTELVKVCSRCGKPWEGQRAGYFYGERGDGMRIWHEGTTLCCDSHATSKTKRVPAPERNKET